MKKTKILRNQRLIQRATMGWTWADQQLIDQLGYKGWLNRQLAHESIDDGGLEAALNEALPTLAMSPAEILANHENDQGQPLIELILAAIYRALYSPRQLFERMVIFWTDHFNIHIFSDLAFLLKGTDDREVIRVHALGSFPALLSASAHSPAMLSYLTNDSNVKGAPNENYARELMELHTLGADNGYDETDVKEVARCFTGWAYGGRGAGSAVGQFFFNAEQHDDGEKRVLGQTIPAGGGVEDGERVIEILAGHPNTARFIAEKMLRYFWRYQPKQSAINGVANIYRNTGGDIKAMLRGVLQKDRIANSKPKLKRPLHLMVSAMRVLSAELVNPRYLVEQLFLTGHLPFDWPPPNGYPDSEGYWSGLVLPRWNFASTFLARERSGIRTDRSLFDPSFSAEKLVATMDSVLFNCTMSEKTIAELTAFLDGGKINKHRIRDALGLAVA
ncbi:MAG: DUF1800 domain-containing protein, partial [Thermoanaerobaculia bacterium]